MSLGNTKPLRQPSTEKPAAKKRPAVLFVCTANIVRSPMAAALFREQLKQTQPDWQDWQIDSAGTWGLDGEMAAKNTRLTMAKRGLDLSSHRARTVTGKMLAGYQLILVMEPNHKEALQVEFPSVADRVYLLSEMEGEGQIRAVEDPYGGPPDAYEEAAKKIDQLLKRGMTRIVALVKKNG